MMSFSKLARTAAVSATLLCATAVAQSRFCIGGDMTRMSPSEKAACSAKLQAVRTAAAALQAPEGWHFVLVCGKQGWKDYTGFRLADNTALVDASADTDLEQHETFFREDRLDLANPAALRRLVAVEVAGILLQSRDQVAINTEAALLLSQAHGI
jgi:hypothetical protein